MLSLDGEDSRITRFLQESLHTNPFRKIPDYNSRQFTFFKQYFTKSVGPGRFSAENLKVDDGQKDGLTDELIWGGLGNLRFLQVKLLFRVPDLARTLDTMPVTFAKMGLRPSFKLQYGPYVNC